MNGSLLCIVFHKSDTFTVTCCRTSELILEKAAENIPETYTFLMARSYLCPASINIYKLMWIACDHLLECSYEKPPTYHSLEKHAWVL